MTQPLDLFHTLVLAPPGAPWVQQRAARVAAELEAPLAVEALETSIVRLDRWAPDQPARLAIGYLRATDQVDERRRRATIDGQDVEFVFRSRAWLARRRHSSVATALALVLAMAAILGAAVKWNAMREIAVAELDARAEIARRAIADDRRQRLVAQRLQVMRQSDLLGRSGARVAEDLAWLSAERTPDAALRTVTWRRGILEVESASAPSPGAEVAGSGQWTVTPRDVSPPAASFGRGWRPSMRRGAP